MHYSEKFQRGVFLIYCRLTNAENTSSKKQRKAAGHKIRDSESSK